MLVEQIYIDNPIRNFNYLIACEATGEALAIDPFDSERCLAMAKEKGWTITQVLNTHEHWDHIGGNEAVIAATGAKLLAHAQADIPNVDTPLSAGALIKVGKTVELEALDTPGHTMTHVCVLSHTDTPALFSGDTVFNAGVGNCGNGGEPAAMYESFNQQLNKLADKTLLYPGHDYMVNNLNFALNCDPNNTAAKGLLPIMEKQDPHNAKITSLGEEKQFNPFFRLTSPAIVQYLQTQFPQMSPQPTMKEVFLCLRELRNKW